MIKSASMRILTFMLLLAMLCCITCNSSMAAGKATEFEGKLYQFDEKNEYKLSESSARQTANSKSSFGMFYINGSCTSIPDKNGYAAYKVSSGELTFTYSFKSTQLNKSDTAWHIIEDRTKKVDTITLDNDIRMGAVIVQSSLDGVSWQTDVMKTNVFTDAKELETPFYTTKPIQQQNGCYYRVIVVYKLQRKTGSHNIAFVPVDEFDTKRYAEVYQFYIEDSSLATATSANDSPRKELGRKVNTGLDNGYADGKSVDKDDPHYGWDIGSFFVNGYTRETKSGSTPVFLKNVGDRVTLWFNLKQDIDNLNGKSTLSISEDKNGYNKAFEVPQTNFGKGTLIIRYTDHEGVAHKPVIYTNYLVANTRTGADTRVQLFEEGDYQVELDYEIMDNPRQIGPVSVVPTFTNYKIAFSFAIRNGNCMVYPFDNQTGSELADRAVTENGFKLDMAKSRYLTIDVTRSVLREGADGSVVEDIRYNRPARDGEAYTDEGIYTFTVKNLYTNESVTKTVFVGNNKYMLALSKSGMTVADLNQAIENGTIIRDDGSLYTPEPITPTPTVVLTNTPTIPKADDTALPVSAGVVETTTEPQNVGAAESSPVLPIVIASIVVVGIVAFVLSKQKGKRK